MQINLSVTNISGVAVAAGHHDALDQAVEHITAQIGLETDEIDRRKAFLEFSESGCDLLRAVHDELGRGEHSVAEHFYSHLRSFAPTNGLLQKSDLARLKRTQGAYFRSLTAGSYDANYVRNRLRVGLVHQRIGLASNWYLGAYRKYLDELMPVLWTATEGDPQRFLSTSDALIKIVLLDMGIALDTYFHAGREAIVQHKDYVEQIISGMPSGLMVINADGVVVTLYPAKG
jgi:hypothetical protein